MEPEILDHTDNNDKGTERKSTNGVASSSSSSNSTINADADRPETGTTCQVAGNDCDEQQHLKRTESSEDLSHQKHVVIDVYEEEEKICRICHLSGEEASRGQNGLMELGCHCKAGLSVCHPYCAETWFKQKGNSVCEVCGVRAKNVKLVRKNVCNNSRMFIVDYDNDERVAGQDGSSPGCCKQSCCNFLLAFLVVGLVVPWFLKTHLF